MAAFTYNEGIQADALVLAAREVLSQAEQIAAGVLVRLTMYEEGIPTYSQVLPFRVAAYARKMLGDTVFMSGEPVIVFRGRGVTVQVQPSTVAYLAFIKVMLSHSEAKLRRNRREERKILAKLRRNEADMKRLEEGGASL